MIYLDDDFPNHPKVVLAETFHDRAPWLYVAGLGYCRKYLTGGKIPPLMVPTLVRNYKPTMTTGLTAAVLWEEVTETDKDGNKVTIGYQIHDYEERNRAEDNQRQSRAEKAKAAADARWRKQV